jgi:hypothetical protein
MFEKRGLLFFIDWFTGMEFIVVFQIFLRPTIFDKDKRKERERNAAGSTRYLNGT